MKCKRNVLILIAILVLMFALATVTAYAGANINVQTYGTYDYGAVQDELVLLNNLRTSYGLNPLILDPVLTEMAMKRAAELAVHYDHIRPDGTRYFTVFDEYSGYTFMGSGENIAMGQGTADAVMSAWTNSSGHFDNMTNSAYRTVGLGCFYQNGMKHWVQLFSKYTVNTYAAPTTAQHMSNINLRVNTDNLALYYEEMGDCAVYLYEGATSKPTIYLRNTGWGSDRLYLSGGYYLASENTNVVTTSDKTVTGVKAGDANIRLGFDSGYYTIPYKVIERPSLKAYRYSDYIRVEFEGHLDDQSNNCTMYYKELGDPTWIQSDLSNYNTSEYIYGISPGEKYTCVIRYYDDDYGWIEVSDRKVITVPLAKPVLKASNNASTGKIVLNWNKVTGANKYVLSRSTSKNGTYTQVYSGTSLSYTDKAVTAGKTYYYKVKAVASSGVSATCNPVVRACDLPNPKNVKLTTVASSGKPKFSWDAVSGADYYEVYRKIGSNGKYEKYVTTKSTSYVHKYAKAGDKYSYKVKAVMDGNSSATSAYSSGKSITCDLAQPTSLKVVNTASTGKPKVTWNAVSGADYYEVYVLTGNGSVYNRISKTSSTYVNHVSANAGVKYTYKVRARISDNSEATSVFSSAKAITCDLKQPVIKVTKTSSGKPKISWNKVSGATKYEVWRKTGSNGTYKKIFTTEYTSLINTSAYSGKTYYYKVKAIHKTSAANSVYSSAKSIKL